VTKVVIVSRAATRDGACIGGLTRDTHRNVCLFPAAEGNGEPLNGLSRIGEVWDLDLVKLAPIQPPHVEGVVARAGRRVAVQDGLDLWLRRSGRPFGGGAAALFDGRLRLTANRKAYVGHESVPSASVGYWVCSDDLLCHPERTNRYVVPWLDGWILVKFVGDEPPPPRIAAGTLIRVSLSPWLQPMANGPEGCWLQISGVYSPSGGSISHLPAGLRRDLTATGASVQARPSPRSIAPFLGSPVRPTAPERKIQAKPFSRAARLTKGAAAKRHLAVGAPSAGKRGVDDRTLLARIAAADKQKNRGRGRTAPIPKQRELCVLPTAKPRALRKRAQVSPSFFDLASHRAAQARAHVDQRMAVAAVHEVAAPAQDRKAKTWTSQQISKLPSPPSNDWREQD
jgi:hypothetical protein